MTRAMTRAMATDPTPHPAKFRSDILDAIHGLLPESDDGHLKVLDPFAGVGLIHELRAYSAPPSIETLGVEIEPEWADQHPHTYVGSALDLSFIPHNILPGYWDVIATSPCYGNRMADTYAGDGTRRHTYRIYLDRELSSGSAAGLQWGRRYRIFHRRAWAEATRVVKPGGTLILNIKDHVRAGQVMRVTDFHARALGSLGWREVERVALDSPGHRHGENWDAREPVEYVIRFDLKENFQ